MPGSCAAVASVSCGLHPPTVQARKQPQPARPSHGGRSGSGGGGRSRNAARAARHRRSAPPSGPAARRRAQPHASAAGGDRTATRPPAPPARCAAVGRVQARGRSLPRSGAVPPELSLASCAAAIASAAAPTARAGCCHELPLLTGLLDNYRGRRRAGPWTGVSVAQRRVHIRGCAGGKALTSCCIAAPLHAATRRAATTRRVMPAACAVRTDEQASPGRVTLRPALPCVAPRVSRKDFTQCQK
jgi:hypothetical protein